MKQKISDKQRLQLSEGQRSILEQWCDGKGYGPALSIGQMFELIQEKRPSFKGVSKDRFGKWFVTIDTVQHSRKDELCDALWEAMTRILKTESEQA